MKRFAGVIAAITFATAVVGPSSSDAATSAPRAATCQRPHQSGQFSRSFTFDGKTRTFQLYVPPAYKGTTPVPLVFNFHGFGSDAVQQMVYGNFKPQADRHDFLIVAPDGQDNGAGRHFSFGTEKGLQNDIDMTQALLTHVERAYCIDATRVYATGMSDGGAMTSLLACLVPTKFAAFAPVAVIIYCGVKRNPPVALASFQGTADPIVPFNGGAVHCCGGAVLASKPVSMAKWAAFDGCAKQYSDKRLGSQVVRRTWHHCAEGSTVVFYIIQGGGHTWPGAIPVPSLGLTTRQIKASDVIWKFFAAHKLAS